MESSSGRAKLRPLVWIALPALVAVCAGFSVYTLVSRYVIQQAETHIRDVLLSHRGLHHYIQQVMHPAFYRARDEGDVDDEYYAPEIFSSSFIRSIIASA